MIVRGRGACLGGLVVALCAAGVDAQARGPAIAFSIPPQPREAALIAFGRQAGVSLGFAPDAHCQGRVGLSGRMDIDEGLRRLLTDSGCAAMRPDARTVVIRARPISRPRPAPEPDAVRPPVDLGELVVTADKTESLLSASPYGLTALTGAELERSGVSDVRDLSLLAAGVTVTNLGPGRDKVLLRGLSDGPLTGHTQSTVGLYLGELRLTYNAPDPDLKLIDVARVEVLRGPQGSLYGAGSIGGILQVVPVDPDPAGRSLRAAGEVATTAHGAASGGLDVVANQPIGRDAAVRVVGWSEITGGDLDNPRLMETNVDRSKRQGVRLSGLWRPSGALTLEAGFIDQTITTRDAHYADPSAGRLTRTTAVAEPHDNDFLALTLAARWRPAWGHVTFSLGALDHDVTTTYDATAAPVSLVAAGGHPLAFKDGNEIRGVVSEVRAASVGARRLHWTIGGFAALGDQRLDAALRAVEPVAAYAEVRRDRLAEYATFGELSYDLTSDVTLTAGGRAFYSRLRTRSQVSVGSPVRTFRGRTVDTGFAPRVLVAYRPAPGFTLYAQAAEGYRTPGFNTSGAPGQTFTTTPGDGQPFQRYAGDELWNYEAGVRWRSPGLGLAFRAAAFQADWSDIQADLVLPSGLPFTANLGTGRSRGVELEGSWSHGELSLTGNLVRQDPELRRPAPGLPARADTGLPGVPDLSLAATARYGLALAPGQTVYLSAGYTYVGASILAVDPLTAPRMGAYGDLRLAVDWDAGEFQARLSAENALDERGDTLAFGNPFSFRAARQSTPQRPRTITLRVSRQF